MKRERDIYKHIRKRANACICAHIYYFHCAFCCSIDKATATLSDTIDFLAKNVQAGVVIDFEHPAEEDPRLSSGSNSWNDLKLFNLQSAQCRGQDWPSWEMLGKWWNMAHVSNCQHAMLVHHQNICWNLRMKRWPLGTGRFLGAPPNG